MANDQQPYVSYLLRIWSIKNGTEEVWRASLENPYNGKRHGFASLQELCVFLETEAEKFSENLRKRET